MKNKCIFLIVVYLAVDVHSQNVMSVCPVPKFLYEFLEKVEVAHGNVRSSKMWTDQHWEEVIVALGNSVDVVEDLIGIKTHSLEIQYDNEMADMTKDTKELNSYLIESQQPMLEAVIESLRLMNTTNVNIRYEIAELEGIISSTQIEPYRKLMEHFGAKVAMSYYEAESNMSVQHVTEMLYKTTARVKMVTEFLEEFKNIGDTVSGYSHLCNYFLGSDYRLTEIVTLDYYFSQTKMRKHIDTDDPDTKALTADLKAGVDRVIRYWKDCLNRKDYWTVMLYSKPSPLLNEIFSRYAPELVPEMYFNFQFNYAMNLIKGMPSARSKGEGFKNLQEAMKRESDYANFLVFAHEVSKVKKSLKTGSEEMRQFNGIVKNIGHGFQNLFFKESFGLQSVACPLGTVIKDKFILKAVDGGFQILTVDLNFSVKIGFKKILDFSSDFSESAAWTLKPQDRDGSQFILINSGSELDMKKIFYLNDDRKKQCPRWNTKDSVLWKIE